VLQVPTVFSDLLDQTFNKSWPVGPDGRQDQPMPWIRLVLSLSRHRSSLLELSLRRHGRAIARAKLGRSSAFRLRACEKGGYFWKLDGVTNPACWGVLCSN